MKKWIRYILFSFLLLAAVPSLIISAEELDLIDPMDPMNSSGTLTVSGTETEPKIDVNLTIPQGDTENWEDKITSLHFQLSISINSGSMKEPVFQFANTIKSEVKDAKAIKDEYSNYIIDIILSGKQDQSIFDSETAEIGTLSLYPTTNAYEISAKFVNKPTDTKPFAEYVTSMGQETQTVLLENTEITKIEKIDTSDTPDTPDTPSTPDTPGTPITPGAPIVSTTPFVPDTPTEPEDTQKPSTENPGNTNTPDNTQNPSEPVNPGSSDQTFDSTTKPKAEVTSKAGKKRISFQWDAIDGADGYVIYQYNAAKNKYKSIKTISNSSKTTFQKTMEKGISYSFKVRAYITAEDGSKIFGKYSAAINITTAPAKVKGLSVKSKSNNKVKLSWKKVKNTKGYQIFRSKKKNGNYTLVKTLSKAATLTATVKQSSKQTYYYKVRAFVKNAEKKRVCGNFSASKKA